MSYALRVSEHRSFWTAVGITLLTIGLGGAISLQIAGLFATDDKHLHWYSPLSLICIALVVGGAVMLFRVLTEILRLRTIKKVLSSKTVAGQELFHQLRVIPDDSEEVPGLKQQAIVWIAETGTWIGVWLPEFEGHFGNVSGLLIREQLQLTSERNVVLVSLETHLERIGEITLKI